MKNYRIARISGIHYLSIMDSFLEQKPEFKNNSYEDQLKLLFQYNTVYSDAFSRSFCELGQEAFDLVVDFGILQKQWAKENDVQYTPENWIFDIMIAQIKQIKPDVMYIQSHVFTVPGLFIKDKPDSNLIKIVKEECPFIKKIIMFAGYPSGADRIQGTDILFASPPSIVEHYRRMGINPILLYHSFDAGILQKLNETEKKYDFSFAGSARAPESRYWAIRQLLERTDLEAWIYKPPHKTHTKSHKVAIKQQVWNALKWGFQLFNEHQMNSLVDSIFVPDKCRNVCLEILRERDSIKRYCIRSGSAHPLNEMYPERCHPPVMGMDMYNLLHQSKITFNKHADAAWGDVGNMRMFEATGVGACLLTDDGSNMQDLFEPDKEVVTYFSIDEAVEKATYLVDHPEEAEQIAKSGQARTLKDHTIMNRCQQIDAVIQKTL